MVLASLATKVKSWIVEELKINLLDFGNVDNK